MAGYVVPATTRVPVAKPLVLEDCPPVRLHSVHAHTAAPCISEASTLLYTGENFADFGEPRVNLGVAREAKIRGWRSKGECGFGDLPPVARETLSPVFAGGSDGLEPLASIFV